MVSLLEYQEIRCKLRVSAEESRVVCACCYIDVCPRTSICALVSRMDMLALADAVDFGFLWCLFTIALRPFRLHCCSSLHQELVRGRATALRVQPLLLVEARLHKVRAESGRLMVPDLCQMTVLRAGRLLSAQTFPPPPPVLGLVRLEQPLVWGQLCQSPVVVRLLRLVQASRHFRSLASAVRSTTAAVTSVAAQI